MIFTNYSDAVKIEDRPFAPSLVEKEGVYYITFNEGYISLVYDLDDNRRPKTVIPSNIDDEFVIFEETEFYLKMQVNPLSNQVEEAEIISKQGVEDQEDQPQYLQYQNILIPIVKIKRTDKGKYYIKEWILRENITWEKKLISTFGKVEYIGDERVLISYCYLSNGANKTEISNFQSEEKSATLESASPNKVIGLFIEGNIILTAGSSQSSVSSAEIISVTPQQVNSLNSPLVSVTTLTEEDGFVTTPTQGNVTKFFPMAFISNSGGVIFQSSFGNFEWSVERISSRVLSESSTENIYNFSIQGVI